MTKLPRLYIRRLVVRCMHSPRGNGISDLCFFFSTGATFRVTLFGDEAIEGERRRKKSTNDEVVFEIWNNAFSYSYLKN